MNEQEVIKSLRNALAKATDLCISTGNPTQNKAQFLSLINGAIADANAVVGENKEIENIRKRWAK